MPKRGRELDSKVKVARTRLYDVVGETPQQWKLKNKEGFVFTHSKSKKNDVVFIGGYSKTEKVSRTKALEIIRGCRTFLRILFKKANGDYREMYARVHKQKDMVLELQDLELDETELRSCRLERILEFVFEDVRYQIK